MAKMQEEMDTMEDQHRQGQRDNLHTMSQLRDEVSNLTARLAKKKQRVTVLEDELRGQCASLDAAYLQEQQKARHLASELGDYVLRTFQEGAGKRGRRVPGFPLVEPSGEDVA